MALNIGGKLPPAPTPAPEPSKKAEAKKAEKEAPAESLLTIMTAIRKSKGEQTIIPATSIPAVRRLPTGIFEFDFYIGGGFPCGRYSIVYGPESSCKSNVALKAVAAAQRLPAPKNKVVWVDLEHQFDPLWAAKLGVNVKDLLIVKPGYGEEAVDVIDAIVRADDLALAVVDSMAAMIASKEIGQSTETYDIGTSALLIKRMVNKLMVAFSEQQKHGNDPCVILINQTRFKPGTMFGDPETMPGGEAQKFLSSLRIRLYGKPMVDKSANAVFFKDVHAVIKKSKVPVRAVAFDFQLCVKAHDDMHEGDTDSFNMVKGSLQALGLLEKVSGGYRAWIGSKGKKGAHIDAPTLGTMEKAYQSNIDFQQQMQWAVITNYKDKMMYVDESMTGPATAIPGVPVQSIAEPNG